jgi:fatty-acyl-CoA synthase
MTRPAVLPPLPWPPDGRPPAVDTLPDLLDLQAARHPDRTALVAGDARLDYRTLAERVGRVSTGLAELGVERGTHVALLVGNVAEWVVAAFAALRLGAVVESFNTWVKAYDLRHLLGSSGAEVLIMTPQVRSADLLGELRELAPDLWETGASVEFPHLRHLVLVEEPRDTPAPSGTRRFADLAVDGPVPRVAARGDETAYVLYTSGTTSLPKAVPLAHRALIENGFAIGERMALGPEDRVWLGSPLFWSYGCANAVMATFGHGACLVLQERFTAESAVALMAAESVTAAYLLPSLTSAFEQEALEGIRAIESLRTGLVIGTPEEFRRTSVGLGILGLCNVYGSTESYGNCCVTPTGMPLEQRMVCQGPPLPGVEVRVADPERGGVADVGEVGEFEVRGRIMRGYIGNDEATAEAMTADGWFRTGDTGRILGDGTVQFVGRATDMIKTSGINVSPAEVESFLAGHPGVAEVGVVGAPHPSKGEVTIAFVVLRHGVQVDEGELLAYCKRSLSGYKTPWAFTVIDALPRTTTGKMLRRELREPAARLVEDRLLAGASS